MGIDSKGQIEENNSKLVRTTANLEEQVARYEQTTAQQAQLLAAERAQRQLAETLNEACLALTAQTSQKAVLAEILHQVSHIVAFTGANIMLWEENGLRAVHWQGYPNLDKQILMAILERSQLEFKLEAEVVQARQPLLVRDTFQSPNWAGSKEAARIRSFIALPIDLPDRMLGVLRVDSDLPDQFSEPDVVSLQGLTTAAAVALKNARQTDSIRREMAERVIQAETEIIQLNRNLLTLQNLDASLTPSSEIQSTFDRISQEIANILKVDG